MKFVRDALDSYLVTHHSQEKGVVELNRLVTHDGELAGKNQNKIIVSMVNLEYETSRQFYGGRVPDGKEIARVNPTQHFNIQTLLCASFDDYQESLKLLAAAIGFFQQYPALNRALFPDMPAGLDLLQLEIENASLSDTYNLWSSLGAKYLPSVIYKIRHVAVDGEKITEAGYRVGQIAGSVSP